MSITVIIGILVALYIFTKINKELNKQVQKGNVPPVSGSGHTENFPFPNLEKQIQQVEQKRRKKKVQEPMSEKIKVDDPAQRSIDVSPGVHSLDEVKHVFDSEKFDVANAVIYSELMTPKFKEY